MAESPYSDLYINTVTQVGVSDEHIAAELLALKETIGVEAFDALVKEHNTLLKTKEMNSPKAWSEVNLKNSFAADNFKYTMSDILKGNRRFDDEEIKR